ncbi:hypothetical protein GQ54DRAFT_295629 [Martensiomyces pterosporus]|nr:hypothetical protein GQ54DRAFT_295629 [Martensiomyces pterosporus]
MSNFVPKREMLYDEAADYIMLQRLAYEYDNYTAPLIPKLHAVSPQATKLTQLQCFPVVGNIIVLYISLNFALQTRRFEGLGGAPFRRMLARILLVFLIGFVPFVSVYATYKLRPLYTSWMIFSDEIDAKGMYLGMSVAGRRAEFPVPHTPNQLPSSVPQIPREAGDEEKCTQTRMPMPEPHHYPPQLSPLQMQESLNLGPPDSADKEKAGYCSYTPEHRSTTASTLTSTQASSRAESPDGGNVAVFAQHHGGGFLDLSSPTEERFAKPLKWLRK